MSNELKIFELEEPVTALKKPELLYFFNLLSEFLLNHLSELEFFTFELIQENLHLVHN